MEEPVVFAILGALGGLLHVLVHTSSLREAVQYANSKWVLIGAICGLAYHFLHSDYNFPNSFMAIVAGYSGADFIVAASIRAKRLLESLQGA
ncbi:MAG: hypothetical protein LM563_03165 [Thermofilum sp.]|nr:hypothetical protein [Thermofilum sp.]